MTEDCYKFMDWTLKIVFYIEQMTLQTNKHNITCFWTGWWNTRYRETNILNNYVNIVIKLRNIVLSNGLHWRNQCNEELEFNCFVKNNFLTCSIKLYLSMNLFFFFLRIIGPNYSETLSVIFLEFLSSVYDKWLMVK